MTVTTVLADVQLPAGAVKVYDWAADVRRPLRERTC
jgi:hypothetical protein